MMIKDQFENLYIQGTLKKKKKDVSCDNEIYTANLKDMGHSKKNPRESFPSNCFSTQSFVSKAAGD